MKIYETEPTNFENLELPEGYVIDANNEDNLVYFSKNGDISIFDGKVVTAVNAAFTIIGFCSSLYFTGKLACDCYKFLKKRD